MTDAIRHETITRGERHANHKLKQSDVSAILKRLECGETHEMISHAFGVSRNAITDIAKGKNWAWLSARRDNDQAPIPFDETQITSAENRSQPRAGDPSHPLAAGARPPTSAFNARQDPDPSGDKTHPLDTDGHSDAVAVALRGRDGGATAELGGDVSGALRASKGGGDKQHIMSSMTVRRITPTEAARLQGFADDYLDITYRKKPAADGPKYRALGNSKATTVVRWIGDRIQRASKP